MKPISPRLIVTLLGAGLLLAGCASHPSRSASTGDSHETRASRSVSEPVTHPQSPTSVTQHHVSHATSHAAGTSSEDTTQLPDSTGVPACDDYLSSYVACHRAAAIYKPDQIQGRYEAMRTSLLRDSQDPDIRPQLAARCNSLASQLRQALHGKSCEGGPAAPASSGSR